MISKVLYIGLPSFEVALTALVGWSFVSCGESRIEDEPIRISVQDMMQIEYIL